MGYTGAFVTKTNGDMTFSGSAQRVQDQINELTFRPYRGFDRNQPAGSTSVTRIQIRVSDGMSPTQTFESEVRIRISNNAPTDITLDTTASPPDSTHDFIPVGKLEAVDIDFNDIHNFHLQRSSDERFLIINSFLYSKTEIDVANLSQHSLTIQAAPRRPHS